MKIKLHNNMPKQYKNIFNLTERKYLTNLIIFDLSNKTLIKYITGYLNAQKPEEKIIYVPFIMQIMEMNLKKFNSNFQKLFKNDDPVTKQYDFIIKLFEQKNIDDFVKNYNNIYMKLQKDLENIEVNKKNLYSKYCNKIQSFVFYKICFYLSGIIRLFSIIASS